MHFIFNDKKLKIIIIDINIILLLTILIANAKNSELLML